MAKTSSGLADHDRDAVTVGADSRAAARAGAAQPQASQRSTLAVALDYDGGERGPTVTAKGRGAVAERIVELALAAGVRVREDSDLAEVLAAVELDSEVPPEALIAVAEILAYIYRANGQAPPEDPLAGGAPGTGGTTDGAV